MRIAALCLALIANPAAMAACSRPIVVPASSIGLSIVVAGDRVSGVYPEVLRQLGPKFGCRFEFPVVPRARADQMFFSGQQADLLVPASRTDERDRKAAFVPLISVTPAVISLKSRALAADSLQALLTDSRSHAVIVRRFVYNDTYEKFVARLSEQQRLETANDLPTLMRMLLARRADFTILAPSLFIATLNASEELRGHADDFRFDVPPDLPGTISGVYLSTARLSREDASTVRALLAEAIRGGPDSVLWQAFKRHYPSAAMRGIETLH